MAGQEEVYSKLPKVGKRSSGNQRKHQTSPTYMYVRLAQEMRMALRMARNIREGHSVGWPIARRLKINGMGIQLPCVSIDGEVLTNIKANYKSALANPVFLKVFRSIS